MQRETPRLLLANRNRTFFDIPSLQAVGMAGKDYAPLMPDDLIPLPQGSELFLLPERIALGYEPQHGMIVRVPHNPFARKEEPCFPVAAFVVPGYAVTYTVGYDGKKNARPLPLFSYGAAAYYKGRIWVAAYRVDREKRQECQLMDIGKLTHNVQTLRKKYPRNRLMRHLERCALEYGCPAGRNFFLERYEASLPTSRTCNARCRGCLSHQPSKKIPVTQPRITFTPTPEEIAEVALHHIYNVKDPIVSFGQGCEGEPLTEGTIIEEAIYVIRKKTSKGMIHLNTNASKPLVVQRLFHAGLNSMRVSMNSVQQKYYERYFAPRGYSFDEVKQSIREAKKKKGFVSLNYFVLPGFTDSPAEVKAFETFIHAQRIDMIQWRNLNYDPQYYLRQIHFDDADKGCLGVKKLIQRIHKKFPHVMKGYFNPARERIKRFQKTR